MSDVPRGPLAWKEDTDQEGRREEVLDEPELNGRVCVSHDRDGHDEREPLDRYTEKESDLLRAAERSVCTDLVQQAGCDGEDVDIGVLLDKHDFLLLLPAKQRREPGHERRGQLELSSPRDKWSLREGGSR